MFTVDFFNLFHCCQISLLVIFFICSSGVCDFWYLLTPFLVLRMHAPFLLLYYLYMELWQGLPPLTKTWMRTLWGLGILFLACWTQFSKKTVKTSLTRMPQFLISITKFFLAIFHPLTSLTCLLAVLSCPYCCIRTEFTLSLLYE